MRRRRAFDPLRSPPRIPDRSARIQGRPPELRRTGQRDGSARSPPPLPPDKPRTGTAFPLDRVPGVYYLCLSNRESVPYISIRIMEQFIMANDTALRISDSGRGETTLALLHGYLESLEVWEDLAKRLAPYYRIVAIDIPGHGISQVRGEVHTMDFVADTLQAVLKKLGVRRCFLAGHSMGGYAAEAFAERHSDMLQGLILFHSTPNADTEQKKADRLREIELIRADKKELLASQFAPKGFAEENRRRLRDRIGQFFELSDPVPPASAGPDRTARITDGRDRRRRHRRLTARHDRTPRHERHAARAASTPTVHLRPHGRIHFRRDGRAAGSRTPAGRSGMARTFRPHGLLGGTRSFGANYPVVHRPARRTGNDACIRFKRFLGPIARNVLAPANGMNEKARHPADEPGKPVSASRVSPITRTAGESGRRHS